jgi:hypothetical protein
MGTDTHSTVIRIYRAIINDIYNFKIYSKKTKLSKLMEFISHEDYMFLSFNAFRCKRRLAPFVTPFDLKR